MKNPIQTLEQLHAQIDFLKEQHTKFKLECPELSGSYKIEELSPSLVSEAAEYYQSSLSNMNGGLWVMAVYDLRKDIYISLRSTKCESVVVSYKEV